MEPDIILDNSDGDSTQSDGVEEIDLGDVDEEWTQYFRYDTAYADQVDAVDTFLNLLADNGLYLLEGACGTGKTLAAVTGGIHAIRDRRHLSSTRCDAGETFPDYSRLVAVTPVKQQLKQFVEELQGVNTSLPAGTKQIPTVVLRGRGDMMPYSYVDIAPFDDYSVRGKIDDLREMTREVIKFGSDIPLDWPDGMSPPEFSLYDYNWNEGSKTAEQYQERYRYDPFRAAAVKEIVSEMASSSGNDFDTLTVNGVSTPYPDYVPHTNDIVDMDELLVSGQGQLPMDLQGKFDPFYAGFFAGEGGLPFGFGDADSFVFDQASLFEAAAKRGICPHEAMAHFAEEAEVVLGNYNHLFDPQTRLLTEDKIGLFDDETIVVVDEAHQVERKVRDMLSTEVDIYTLDRAISDIEIARQYAVGDHEKTPTPELSGKEASRAQSLVKNALDTAGNYSVDADDLNEAARFLRFAKQKLGEYGADKLNDRYKDVSWRRAVENWELDTLEKELADPEQVGDTDQLYDDVLASDDFDHTSFTKVYQVMLGIKFVYDALEEEGIYDRTPQGVGVGEFFRRWVTEDRVEYHHQVVLDDNRKDSVPDSFPEWVRGWTPSYQLFNCVPRDELRGVFAEIGGGVLMSATIQPADVFKEAIGIDDVPYPTEEDDGDENSTGASSVRKPDSDTLDESDIRPTEFEQYPLRFPSENRLSMTVDLPKYINDNRGDPTQDPARMTDTRRKYAKMLREIVSTRGNVMIAMPNYREAKWVYEFIKNQDPSKRLHLDQSSSDQETTETLEAFFADGEAVIFTSCRGTITEGVDYDGGKLHCCAAVGIPLLPSHMPRIKAIRTAYDERMGSRSGYETALTIPAVRKVRQAFGRVIRGSDETGVRLLLDNRYASTAWDGVEEYLSDQEQEEFGLARPDRVGQMVSTFWEEAESREQETSDTDDEATSGSEQTSLSSSAQSTPDEKVADESKTGNDESGSGSGRDYSVDPTKTAKVYFGKEATLNGWVTLQTDIVEQEIVPLVREYEVEDADGVETISLNFSKELSVSGWTDVRADAVLEEIEPIAEDARPHTA
ncbi:ATP-dependent DNA helicase [Halosimplex pelagicum]|nr:helicase C-terminal domain-containing protein [Halosimplex pelagicum]